MTPFTRLHRKIALRLAFLLTAAMVLIALAVCSASQRAMVQIQIDDARRFLQLWQQNGCGQWFSGADIGTIGKATEIVCLDLSTADNPGDPRPWLILDAAMKHRLREGLDLIRFRGLAWGVFWRQPAQLVVVVPAPGKYGTTTAAAGIWDLTSIYQRIRKIQPMIIGYMLVNLAALLLIGHYLFARVTVKPLQRLVRRAENYSDGDKFFLAGTADDDDYGRLSHVLNRIYGRIQSDRLELAATVEQLKVANSELGQAQKEVQRAEKLAAIGRLSAGLAHEIGNPLGIVTGYLELMRQPGLSAAEREDIVTRTQDEVGRIGRIMRQLLDLARPAPDSAEIFTLHALILETARIFECQPLTRGIEIKIEPNASRDRVKGDPERIRQVFLNLMINAADAIKSLGSEHPGRLVIGTENQDDSIRVVFRDNGIGIPAEHLPLIFDPFFSTKKVGQGTGLGLAVSFMIVEAMGGAMTASSRPGQGTTLQLDLPLAADDVP